MGKIVENYFLEETIGSGAYGKVYKARHIVTGQPVAIKVIKAQKIKELPKLEECTVNEINTLSHIEPCEHIVRYLDMLKTSNNFYFIYEYCNGGTLASHIKSFKNVEGGVMPLEMALNYFSQLQQAFKVLSRRHIIHRDLKPDNILLHNNCIKVADFGFCKNLQGTEDVTDTMLGSPIYMAPEVIRGERYTIKADIWSLGVVLYEMIFGFCPFNSSSIAKLIQTLEKEELRFPFEIPQSVRKLLERMLVKNSNQRIDFEELFKYTVEKDKIVYGQIRFEPKHMRTKSRVEEKKALSVKRNSLCTTKAEKQTLVERILSGNAKTENREQVLRGSMDSISMEKKQNISATNSYNHLNHHPSSFQRSPNENTKKCRFARNVIEIHDLCLHIMRLVVQFFKNDSSNHATFIIYEILQGIQSRIQNFIKVFDENTPYRSEQLIVILKNAEKIKQKIESINKSHKPDLYDIGHHYRSAILKNQAAIEQNRKTLIMYLSIGDIITEKYDPWKDVYSFLSRDQLLKILQKKALQL